MRTFLSFDISDPTFLKKMQEMQRELVGSGADLKLIRSDIVHFTIRFLGEIDEQDKVRVIDNLKGKVEDFELEIDFRGVGAFPDERRISVIWIGVDEDSAKKLQDHAKKVNSILASIPGLPKEEARGFSPHVTIARVRSGRNKENLVQVVREHSKDEFGRVNVKNLRLKMSELSPSGPNYSDLHVFER